MQEEAQPIFAPVVIQERFYYLATVLAYQAALSDFLEIYLQSSVKPVRLAALLAATAIICHV